MAKASFTKERLKKFFFLDELSHHEIMEKTRQDLVLELKDKPELRDFLLYEPVRLRDPIRRQLIACEEKSYIMGPVRSFEILKPKKTSLCLRLFARFLRSALVYEDELKILQRFSKDSPTS